MDLVKWDEKYITNTGLNLPEGLPFETWEKFVKQARFLNKLSLWIWGDLILYGERNYGEMYAQALEESDYSYETLKQAVWLCGVYQLCDRSHNLPWSFYLQAAIIEDKKVRDELLGTCENENWARRELRQEVQEYKKNKQQIDLDDRQIVEYGENIFYLSTKKQEFDQSFHIINNNKYPTLMRRSWFYHPNGKEFSLREYAQVQEFPDSFKFVGTYETIKDQIGNAVSPTMSKFISKDLEGETFGDLFAGCGGLSLGLEMNNKKALWAIERNEKYARTYSVNFPDVSIVTRNIKGLDPNDFKGVDIIVGGPPCQGLSGANWSQQDFVNDSRNELYKEFVRFVSVLKPKEFIMENVPEIEGFSKTIIGEFNGLGYEVEGKLVKGEDIGMSQKRHRYFFIGGMR